MNSWQVPYAKPIPKNFQAQWNEQRPSKESISEYFQDKIPATGQTPET